MSNMLIRLLDTKVLKDEILNIMIAGRDTTAGTLTFVFYLLSQHPDVMKRLREEILSKLGNNRPAYEELRDMKYLRAVINGRPPHILARTTVDKVNSRNSEALSGGVSRSVPAISSMLTPSNRPFNVRTTNKAVIWPSLTPGAKPYYIPAGTRFERCICSGFVFVLTSLPIRCPYSVFLMQRRKDLWGADAEEFDPDRFLDERVQKYLTHNPFIFLPFNAGPRICLGQQVSLTFHSSAPGSRM